MTANLRGDLSFALSLRATKLLGLVLIAVAISLSTVLFQTVTSNYILTPSLMGLDSLYQFGQTLLIFMLGGIGFVSLNPYLKFGGEVFILVGFMLAIFIPLLRARLDLGLLLLAGLVFGVLFRSLSSLLARLIDPNEFAVVPAASFANFGRVREDLLLVGAAVTIICAIIAWRCRHVLDVIALGSTAATGLGVNWRRAGVGILVVVAVLVAVSTALVGPIAFFGLLIAALAERAVDTRRHAVLLPAAALVAIILLVGGQTLLQISFGGATSLGVVIEFVGGLAFLLILFKSVKA